jgi:WD40 repeat protein
VAVGELEGRPVVVSGGRDGTVRVWDLARGTPVGKPLKPRRSPRSLLWGHDSRLGVTYVAIGDLKGRPVVVSGGGDGTVRVWDLARGTLVGEPISGHEGWVGVVAVGELEGRPVIVSREWGTVRVWDLARGTLVGEPITGHMNQVSTAAAVGELEGRPVVVSGGGDGTVRVWDLARGTPVGEPLTGHQGGVNAVAVGQLEGRPVVISGGHDLTVRVWEKTGRLWQTIEVGSHINAFALVKDDGCVLGGTMGVMSLSLKRWQL